MQIIREKPPPREDPRKVIGIRPRPVRLRRPRGRSAPPAISVGAIVVHAFSQNPGLEWTPVGLATWYGIPLGRVRDALVALLARGLVRSAGAQDLYRWAGGGSAAPPSGLRLVHEETYGVDLAGAGD